jgi:hypothetical protein
MSVEHQESEAANPAADASGLPATASQEATIIELPLMNFTPTIFNDPEALRASADKLVRHTQAIQRAGGVTGEQEAGSHSNGGKRSGYSFLRKHKQEQALRKLAALHEDFRQQNPVEAADTAIFAIDSDTIQTLEKLKNYLGKGAKSLHVQFAQTEDPVTGKKTLSVAGFRELVSTVSQEFANPTIGRNIKFSDLLDQASKNKYVKIPGVSVGLSEHKIIGKIKDFGMSDGPLSPEEKKLNPDGFYLIYPPECADGLMRVIKNILDREMPETQPGKSSRNDSGHTR